MDLSSVAVDLAVNAAASAFNPTAATTATTPTTTSSTTAAVTASDAKEPSKKRKRSRPKKSAIANNADRKGAMNDPNADSTAKSSKRGRPKRDPNAKDESQYDIDDPFIDDSELLDANGIAPGVVGGNDVLAPNPRKRVQRSAADASKRRERTIRFFVNLPTMANVEKLSFRQLLRDQHPEQLAGGTAEGALVRSDDSSDIEPPPPKKKKRSKLKKTSDIKNASKPSSSAAAVTSVGGASVEEKPKKPKKPKNKSKQADKAAAAATAAAASDTVQTEVFSLSTTSQSSQEPVADSAASMLSEAEQKEAEAAAKARESERRKQKKAEMERVDENHVFEHISILPMLEVIETLMKSYTLSKYQSIPPDVMTNLKSLYELATTQSAQDQQQIFARLGKLLPWTIKTIKSRIKKASSKDRIDDIRDTVSEALEAIKRLIQPSINAFLIFKRDYKPELAEPKNVKVKTVTNEATNETVTTFEFRVHWSPLLPHIATIAGLVDEYVTLFNAAVSDSSARITARDHKAVWMTKIRELWPAECDVKKAQIAAALKRYLQKFKDAKSKSSSSSSQQKSSSMSKSSSSSKPSSPSKPAKNPQQALSSSSASSTPLLPMVNALSTQAPRSASSSVPREPVRQEEELAETEGEEMEQEEGEQPQAQQQESAPSRSMPGVEDAITETEDFADEERAGGIGDFLPGPPLRADIVNVESTQEDEVALNESREESPEVVEISD